MQKYDVSPAFPFLYVSLICENVNIHKRMPFSADFIVPLCNIN